MTESSFLSLGHFRSSNRSPAGGGLGVGGAAGCAAGVFGRVGAGLLAPGLAGSGLAPGATGSGLFGAVSTVLTEALATGVGTGIGGGATGAGEATWTTSLLTGASPAATDTGAGARRAN